MLLSSHKKKLVARQNRGCYRFVADAGNNDMFYPRYRCCFAVFWEVSEYYMYKEI